MHPTQWALPPADTYFGPMLAQDPRGFQVDHLELALSHCRRFRTAVDGGAHIGTWSVAMAQKFERVLAFEPAADTYQCLRQNVAHIPNVYPQCRALATRLGHVKVVDDVTRPGNTGSRYVAETDDILNGVQAIALDQCQIDDLDFLKLDLEGYELPALRGAVLTIARCKPLIMIEVKRLRADVDPMAAVQWLISHGYREVAKAGRDHVFIPE